MCRHVHVDMCVEMGSDMSVRTVCRHVCKQYLQTFVYTLYIQTFVYTLYIQTFVCGHVCYHVCVDMCADMCVDIRVGVCRHVFFLDTVSL